MHCARLDTVRPDIVGISALSDELYIGRDIARIAKQWDPSVTVIWGNKAPTMAPEKVLADRHTDYLCCGEGIEAFPEFIEALEKGSDPGAIRNIFSRATDGSIKRTALRPYYQDLDRLPPLDWSIFDERHFLKPYDGKVYRGGDHMLFWGCPNICTYCINEAYRTLHGPHAGKYLRNYSIERIVGELEELIRQWDIGFFKFHDEDFCLKPLPVFEALADAYQRRVRVPFTIMANARTVSAEKVALLKHMNCVSVTLGIETGNDRLRREVLKRRETVDDIVRATNLFHDAGIRTASFNMLGIPFETRQTVMETIEVNKRAGIRYPNAGFFFPLENTELREIAIANGFFDRDSNAVFQNDRPTLRFSDLSAEELIALRERFVLYIKMPYTLYPYIHRSEQKDALGEALTKELYSIYDSCVFQNDGVWNDHGRLTEYTARLEQIMRKGVS